MAHPAEPPRHPVALLEPHPVFREALADWLEAHGPYRVGWCGAEADGLFAALEQGPAAGEARPALVLVGLRPPAEEGLQVLAAVLPRRPERVRRPVGRIQPLCDRVQVP